MTLCKHYFCENCALKNYVNDSKCFICGSETKGSFNTATDIEAKMKKAKTSEPKLEEEDLAPQEEDAVLDKFANK